MTTNAYLPADLLALVGPNNLTPLATAQTIGGYYEVFAAASWWEFYVVKTMLAADGQSWTAHETFPGAVHAMADAVAADEARELGGDQ